LHFQINRWVSFKEVVASVYCSNPLNCEILPMDCFPEGFQPAADPRELIIPDVDEVKNYSVKSAVN